MKIPFENIEDWPKMTGVEIEKEAAAFQFFFNLKRFKSKPEILELVQIEGEKLDNDIRKHIGRYGIDSENRRIGLLWKILYSMLLKRHFYRHLKYLANNHM